MGRSPPSSSRVLEMPDRSKALVTFSSSFKILNSIQKKVAVEAGMLAWYERPKAEECKNLAYYYMAQFCMTSKKMLLLYG